MNLRRAFLALGATILGAGILGASPAFATVTCSNVSTTASWPAANQVQKCDGSGTTAHSGIVRSTLETLGAQQNDASVRLKEIQQTEGDIIRITITDTALPSGAQTVTHVITTQDSLLTITSDLASKITSLPGQAYPGELFYASFSGGTLTIFSFTGNATTYSGVVRNPTDSGAGSETITFGVDGSGNKTATIDGTISASLKWFDFADSTDFQDTSRTGQPKPDPSVTGVEDGFTQWYDIPFERNAMIFESNIVTGSNTAVAHTTAHETGHHLDRIYGKAVGDGGKYAETEEFIAALEIDLANMNAISPCTEEASDGKAVDENQNPTGGFYASSGTTESASDGGYGGFFTGQKSSTGAYICSGPEGLNRGTANNFSGNTLTILRAAYPWFDGHYNVPTEIFAEWYSVLAGFDDMTNNSGNPRNGSDRLLLENYQAYVCTRQHVEKLMFEGRAPTALEKSYIGYSVPERFGGGPDQGKLGPGSKFHRCDGTVGDLEEFYFGT